MGIKLKASDIIEIDEKFLNDLSAKLKNKVDKEKEESIPEYYTVKEVSKKARNSKEAVLLHIHNWLNDIEHKKQLRANKQGGKSWKITHKDLIEYLKQ